MGRLYNSTRVDPGRDHGGPAQPVDALSIRDERELVSMCVALGATSIAGWSTAEVSLAERAGPPPPNPATDAVRAAIAGGADPLGDWLTGARSPARRRIRGATYTPPEMVEAMLAWARARTRPVRVVDPGTGSARFLLAAATAFPDAELVGVELDPVAAAVARANLAARGLAGRARVLVADFRHVALGEVDGPTLFLGNPPYVRHHQLDRSDKEWLKAGATRRGLSVSGRAGLHVHFFLATLDHARPGDLGLYVTASEWLDVDYGKLVRELLHGPLGLDSLFVLDPTALPFADAQTTAAIAGFRVGEGPPTVDVERITRATELGGSPSRHRIPRERLSASRWSALTRPERTRPAGYVELGELCRVHRGQVTGSNRTWVVERDHALPESLLLPVVSRAMELFAAGDALTDAGPLRRLIALPADLDQLDPPARAAVDRFLERARAAGVADGYIASHRKVWWSIPLRPPAPILATYMARRPPAFVRNLCSARHINIAHGLYPRAPLPEPALDALARYLRTGVATGEGRTYAGGLTKFEPREMERLLVPGPELLLG